jgi:acyl carrier protein
MNKKEIFPKVVDILRDIFSNDRLKVSNETNANDIEAWDSLNHINIVSVVEREFNIKFALGELADLQNISNMVDLIFEKTNK